ncbi:unnamed protein product [Sphagnum tenellum]
MVRLKVQTDFGKLNDWVKTLSEKDLPYITARSLTDLAGKEFLLERGLIRPRSFLNHSGYGNSSARRGYLNVSGTASGKEVILKQTRSGKTRRRKSKIPRKRPHRPHKGKRGWTRETLYVLKSGVHIPAKFPFLETAQAVVRGQYEAVFRKNLESAL